MKTKKTKKQLVRAIAKNNPQVDQRIVGEVLLLIGNFRKMGIKARGFNLLRSSESRLKVKGSSIYHL